MCRLAGVLLLVVLAVRPAAAGSMLIATAASEGRLNGFCLLDGGGFRQPATPRKSIELANPYPRRILFVPETRAGRGAAGVVYVAEIDRVTAFRIDDQGTFGSCGTGDPAGPCRAHTQVLNVSRPVAVAVHPGSQRLYVVERGLDRITVYKLDDNGMPVDAAGMEIGTGETDPFVSCVQGPGASGYAEIVESGDRIYISALAGRVEAFQVNDVGDVCTDATCAALVTAADCPTRNETGKALTATTPVLQRRRVRGPTSLFVMDGLLYVQESYVHQISAFRLDDLRAPPAKVCKGGPNAGQPCTGTATPTDCPRSSCVAPKVCTGGPNLWTPCAARAECPGAKCARVAPDRVSHTNQLKRYSAMVHAGPTLLGSQFSRGRIDAFPLQQPDSRRARCRLDACPGTSPQCCLPKESHGGSKEDVRMSPVGLFVAPARDDPESTAPAPGDQVLYVAAGELDRIRAYRLNANGVLKSPDPFDETDEQEDAFPNDVAVAVLKSGCE